MDTSSYEEMMHASSRIFTAVARKFEALAQAIKRIIFIIDAHRQLFKELALKMDTRDQLLFLMKEEKKIKVHSERFLIKHGAVNGS